MQMGPTEILGKLAKHADNYILDALCAPYRSDLKKRTVTVIAQEGEFQILGDGVPQVLDDFIRASLIYEATPLDENYRRTYRLTPEGQKRGSK